MAEDELTKLRTENIRLRNELDKQLNAWGGYVDAHAGNYSRMNARIAELEQANRDLNTMLQVAVKDNKRLRHLDAMPVDAMERYIYAEYGDEDDSSVDWKIITEWLTSRDGDA